MPRHGPRRSSTLVNPQSPPRSLLVTDFDGTLTREDFYQLAIRNLLPPDVPDYWGDYREGRLTHFQALQAYFSHIREDESTGRKVIERMQLEPRLAEIKKSLASADATTRERLQPKIVQAEKILEQLRTALEQMKK